MTGGVRIRLAFIGEYDAVADLTVAGFAHHRNPTAERVALLRDAAGRARDGELLVAMDELSGALVGTASLLRAGTPSGRLAGPGEAELRLLTVLPEYRRSGVGYALMQAAIDRARLAGAASLVLDTGPTNTASQRLYHRLGFVRLPDRETHVLPDGRVLFAFGLDLDTRSLVTKKAS